MSTDPTGTTPTGTTPTGTTPAEPLPSPATPADPAAAPHDSTTGADDEFSSGDGTGSGEEGESFFGRHSGVLVALMTAIVVVAAAVAGLAYYKNEVDDRNADTAAAFTSSVEERGATVETVECDGDTCAAVISGQAYTILVQEDQDGDQHFGIAAYTGD
jgi:hypothetical protein